MRMINLFEYPESILALTSRFLPAVCELSELAGAPRMACRDGIMATMNLIIKNGPLTSSIICALIILGVILVPCRAGDLQSEGQQHMEARNFSKALECFNLALQQQPRNWQLLQKIGNCQMQLGKNEAAVSSLQKSIEIGGLHASQCTIMAAALEALGQPRKALSWLQLACSVEPAMASNPGMQAAIRRLQDPLVNPVGSPAAADYLSGLVSVNKWRKSDFPLKIYIRKNIQIPEFYDALTQIVRESMSQWSEATGGALSYKFVHERGAANLIWDYTDRRELVSTDHEQGLDGTLDMKIRTADKTPAEGNIVILVKDSPFAKSFRDRQRVTATCLHEIGHALGMHGHSPNRNDVMFLASTAEPITKLSTRDKNTIRKLYRR